MEHNTQRNLLPLRGKVGEVLKTELGISEMNFLSEHGGFGRGRTREEKVRHSQTYERGLL